MQNITFFPTTFLGGNIIIDKSTLQKMDFKEDDKLICYLNNESELIIKKQKDVCIFCGKTNSLHTIVETSICTQCKEDLKEYTKN